MLFRSVTLTPSTDATDANATQTIAKTWCVHETGIDGVKYVYSVKETLPDPDNWTVTHETTAAANGNPQIEKIKNTYKVPTYTRLKSRGADRPTRSAESRLKAP